MIPRKKRWRYLNAAREIAKRLSLPDPVDDWETIWSLLDKNGLPVYLYAIADNRNKIVKFGKSQNPVHRLKTIKTGNALELYLCGYCKNESPLTEKEVHAKLKPFRVAGEWFRLSDEVQETILAIKHKSTGIT